MIFRKLVVGMYGVNCYIIGDENTKKGAIIDPGENGEGILNLVKENGLEIEYIILTHSHGDHIGALEYLRKNFNCKVVAHIDEKELLNDADKNLTAIMGMPEVAIDADVYVKEGDELRLGDLNLKFYHTPGHTSGCMCVLVNDALFTGDTLFAGSIGRTDLYSGDYSIILKSLEKLGCLDESLAVYPGHGPASQIRIEKNNNPYFNM